MMDKRRKWILVIAGVLLVLVADGLKSYLIARRAVAHRPNLECTRVLFVGVWFVSFKFDGAHPGSVATFTVAPLLPWVIAARYCR